MCYLEDHYLILLHIPIQLSSLNFFVDLEWRLILLMLLYLADFDDTVTGASRISMIDGFSGYN
jgi:hypothetical protein